MTEYEPNSMIKEVSWKEFRQAGLLWFINSILHTFGYAIAYDFDNREKSGFEHEPDRVYPARVKFRGFTEDLTSKGYILISEYIKENIGQLLEEAKS